MQRRLIRVHTNDQRAHGWFNDHDRVGNPLDPVTQMGPLTSKEHQERVLAFCDIAVKEGGDILGGVGDSGYGRELGVEAMYEYTEAKSVWVNVDAPTVASFGEE